MKCPECGRTHFHKSKITQTWVESRNAVWRRRNCKCGHSFTTYETYADQSDLRQSKVSPWGRKDETRVMPGEFVAQFTRPQYGRILKASLVHNDKNDIATAAGYGSHNSISKALTRIRRDIEALSLTKDDQEISDLYKISSSDVAEFRSKRMSGRVLNESDLRQDITRLSLVVDEDNVPISVNAISERLNVIGYSTTPNYVGQAQRKLYAQGYNIPRLEAACQKNPVRYSSLMRRRQISLSKSGSESPAANGQDEKQSS